MVSLHSCSDHSHYHVNDREADDLRHIGRALWLIAPDKNRQGVLRLKAGYAVRGFSERFGQLLARIRHTELGRLLMAEITLRPMEGD